ncbi:MAG: acetolactate synthase large subunit [Actinobacteria bacterium]|nr:acetolactate synthase large subunit [Actinomycetota bacterium]
MSAAEIHGSNVCFANPGTTELAFVAALDTVEGMRPVLGLHENICTGAADGWARMTGEVGLTMLHLGVGLSNGLANLHNARRAHTPIVAIVGDHPSWHLRNDPPLASDLYGLATAGTSRAFISSDYDTGSAAYNAAWATARASSAPVALIVRADDAIREQPVWSTPTDEHRAGVWLASEGHHPQAEKVLEQILRADNPALLLGGKALNTSGKHAAQALRSALGLTLFTEAFPAIEHSGVNLPRFESLTALTPAKGHSRLSKHDLLVLIGAQDPAAFFADEHGLGRLRPDTTQLVTACSPTEAAAFLQTMSQYLPPVVRPGGVAASRRTPPADNTALDPLTFAGALVGLQPEGAIVVDESNTAGDPYRDLLHLAAPHIQMRSTAGSLGFGMAAAIGAAIAAPQRRIINLQADGAAAYSAQALWTQAREQLDVTTVLLDNGAYNTVRTSWRAFSGEADSCTIRRLSELREPALDWVSISEGFGVTATRVNDVQGFRCALMESFNTAGPHVIVVDLPES